MWSPAGLGYRKAMLASLILLVFGYAVLINVAQNTNWYLTPRVKRQWTMKPGWKIPPIIHQSWKDVRVPIETDGAEIQYKDLIPTWLKFNPEWTYLFWTDEDNDRLFDTTPELKPYKDAYFSQNLARIGRADFSRYAYMYLFGGVYADIDFECLRNFDEIAMNFTGFLSSEPMDQTMALYRMPVVACNAIMGSRKGHPFWLHVMQKISAKVHSGDKKCIDDVNHCTGPQTLQRAYAEYVNDPANEIMPMMDSALFYPEIATYNTNIRKGCDEMKASGEYMCQIDLPAENRTEVDSYAKHHWACVWMGIHNVHNFVEIDDLVGAHNLYRPFDGSFVV